jgi:hypothetical protein
MRLWGYEDDRTRSGNSSAVTRKESARHSLPYGDRVGFQRSATVAYESSSLHVQLTTRAGPQRQTAWSPTIAEAGQGWHLPLSTTAASPESTDGRLLTAYRRGPRWAPPQPRVAP